MFGCSATSPSAAWWAPRTPSAAASEGTTAPSEAPSVAPPTRQPSLPVRVAIVGDSLTAGGGARLLSEGLDSRTWMTYAKGDGIEYAGGWAMGGSTVETMAENVRPIVDVDVLVLMGGTNDVRNHTDFASVAPNYDAIVDVVRPGRVVIGAIPPLDSNPDEAARFNWKLKQYVAKKGWDYVDPWGFARDGGFFAPGTSYDGIHPTTHGYALVGKAYRDAILHHPVGPSGAG
ncbi:SGNH/GDSL hydrolase family protein [Agromyces sp. SYSU K20354]|uniref:SGNH/GDSL hydrolase family protein n=1 Tax=Agromyces cavernae TaxID=2898659 RepID=UPI001E5AB0BA|nr:SGNH/GDSL hydrolase family protein [Agromyces cavernae]MCD2444040.1 SGNH/GDSL hydrolase family protein [Agromyces cavernae]